MAMVFRRIRLGHEWYPAPPRLDRCRCLLRSGTSVPANIGPLADGARCDIVALANHSLEDQCVSRPSRSSSNANHPVNPNPTLQNRRSGEGWMPTLRKVSKINEMGTNRLWITRPPPVVTTAPERQAATFTSAPGCKECRKLTARCAWAAAWKIARLSLASTESHDCRYEA